MNPGEDHRSSESQLPAVIFVDAVFVGSTPDTGLRTYPSQTMMQPISKMELYYLAEGAANVLYRVKPQGNDLLDPAYRGKLLRFRKDKPDLLSCSELETRFNLSMLPIFTQAEQPVSRWLLRNELRNEVSADLIHQLNESLLVRERNGTRPKMRHGVYLAMPPGEPGFFLTTDMSPRNETENLIEFKPKWLIQSPSAPDGAVRCRTCALRHMRGLASVELKRRDLTSCPLRLLSRDPSDLLPELQKIFPQCIDLHMVQQQFEEKVWPLLGFLRSKQEEYNAVGLQDFVKSPDDSLSIAMALRDCSVFIRLELRETDGGREVVFQDVKLADLDMKKTNAAKREKWASTERSLHTGNWYTSARGAYENGSAYLLEMKNKECALARKVDIQGGFTCRLGPRISSQPIS